MKRQNSTPIYRALFLLKWLFDSKWANLPTARPAFTSYDLSKALMCSQATAWDAITLLETWGYIKREQLQGSKTHYISISDSGEQFYDSHTDYVNHMAKIHGSIMYSNAPSN